MVKINGEEKNAAGKTVGEYLKENEIDESFVATEINGKIVPRANYSFTVFKDGDRAEIVSFVGGG